MGALDHEWTAGGLFLYLAAFLFLALPLIIFAFESRAAKLQSRLPAPSKSLPKPPPTVIKEIRIYPIKSCRGIKVDKAKLLRTGFDLDRQWMFVDAKEKKFLTIRQISEMTLIDTKISDDDELVISIRNKEPKVEIKIPAHPTKQWLKANTTLSEVEIWGTIVDGWIYSTKLSDPFSSFFNSDVRLVYKGPTPRRLKGNASPENLGRTESTKFADLMPVQISNQKSIDELNFRLKNAGEEPITIERFRPNIVVEGETPWYEDQWRTVKIGAEERNSVTLDVVARCARCQVPNVDPETAVKHKHQPWDTLMKYRRIDEGIKFKPCFGMLCIPREEGELSVGEDFFITEVTEGHRYIAGLS